jgi:PhnB protein
MTDALPTYSTVTPYLVVPDADREIEFLTRAFGATAVEVHRGPDQTVMHAELRIGDSLIMLGQSGDHVKARSAALYLWVTDVDATYAAALTAGATSESAPEDKPYGHRNAGIIDPNGVTWWIGAPVA